MRPLQTLTAAVTAAALAFCVTLAVAQDRSTLPRHGNGPKTEAMLAADAKLLQQMDAQFAGDRRRASQAALDAGWALMRRGAGDDAMRRFNQAWLLDPQSGPAFWGMGIVMGMRGDLAASAALFADARRTLAGDIDFDADDARTASQLAIESRDDAVLQQAYRRFASVQQRAPQHTLNLQNWAIALYETGDFEGAWRKVVEAEGTPRRAVLDPAFIAALTEKMPRPR